MLAASGRLIRKAACLATQSLQIPRQQIDRACSHFVELTYSAATVCVLGAAPDYPSKQPCKAPTR